jgi:hypothetical protein
MQKIATVLNENLRGYSENSFQQSFNFNLDYAVYKVTLSLAH